MQYLGHFSFIGYDGDEISHGLLSAVVSADDIDSAAVQFHTLLEQKQTEAGKSAVSTTESRAVR